MTTPPSKKESGNVLLYVFLAVGLLAALTYSFVKDSRENFAAQNAAKAAEDLFIQSTLIRSAIQQCVMEFSAGGGDLNADGAVDENDNPNNPYPLSPSSALMPAAPAGIAAAANDQARNLSCIGAPANEARMFQGAGNTGRFLPPPPSGFNEWLYKNDANGTYIQITSKAEDASSINALERVIDKFAQCQADINYNNCGAGCLTIWMQRISCP